LYIGEHQALTIEEREEIVALTCQWLGVRVIARDWGDVPR
jgi:hypothetical protein